MKRLATIRYIARIAEMSRWTNASSRSWQRRQQLLLNRLVNHASQYSPVYRERLASINLQSFELGQLEPIGKSELTGRLSEHLTVQDVSPTAVDAYFGNPNNLGKWFQDKYCLYQTSGTQGSALTIVQDWQTMQTVFACMAARSRADRRPSIFELFRRWREPKRIAFVTARPGFFPSSAAMYLLPQFVGKLMDLRVFSIMSPTINDELAAFRPHALFGYASSLDHLARSGVTLGQQLEHINNSSEQLTETIRQRLQTTFQVPILDHYGCGECLQLADLCPAGRLHVNADLAILEPVDEQLQPVPAGVVSSKVLVTNLANFVQPFIRYVVDDRICMSTDTKCSCGSNLPQIEALHGRASDQLIVQSNTGQTVALPAIVFQNVTDHDGRILEWRVVQEGNDELVFEWQTMATSNEEQSQHFAEFEQQLRNQGLPQFVRLRYRQLTAAVLDPKSGKRKRLVCVSNTPLVSATTV